MENKNLLDVLKTAILMEKRGQALYEEVASKTADPDVKKIFNIMAEEEKLHAKMLGEQFKNFSENKSFVKQNLAASSADQELANMILTGKITANISAAGFEAAAIGAAIDMETKSIEVYRKRAEESNDPEEKALFHWLADWEGSHYELLLKLDNDLKDQIWADNQFWPF
ncbi:MAG TPA: ferritin family protein [Bacteroidales bacterium]|nr:ferritin family protein [Bacteroidales bacterium]HQL71261.1 ferritin family protein [Bacteroidales bacterium]